MKGTYLEKTKTVANKRRGDSNIFDCNPVVLKKKVKPLKIAIIWAQHAQKGLNMNGRAMCKTKDKFLSRNS